MPIRLAMKPGVSLQLTTLLPSSTIGECAIAVDNGAVSAPADDFQQAHVARRVEEMRDQKSRAKRLAAALASALSAEWWRCWKLIAEPGLRTASSF